MAEIISYDKLRGAWNNQICPDCPKQIDNSCALGGKACLAIEMLRQLSKANSEDRNEWLDNILTKMDV